MLFHFLRMGLYFHRELLCVFRRLIFILSSIFSPWFFYFFIWIIAFISYLSFSSVTAISWVFFFFSSLLFLLIAFSSFVFAFPIFPPLFDQFYVLSTSCFFISLLLLPLGCCYSRFPAYSIYFYPMPKIHVCWAIKTFSPGECNFSFSLDLLRVLTAFFVSIYIGFFPFYYCSRIDLRHIFFPSRRFMALRQLKHFLA